MRRLVQLRAGADGPGQPGCNDGGGVDQIGGNEGRQRQYHRGREAARHGHQLRLPDLRFPQLRQAVDRLPGARRQRVRHPVDALPNLEVLEAERRAHIYDPAARLKKLLDAIEGGRNRQRHEYHVNRRQVQRVGQFEAKAE